MGRPPPYIRAMPERKRFFFIDVFPMVVPTYGRTGVGARNAFASKQREVEKTWHRTVILMAGCVHLVGYERATGYYMRSPCGRRCSCIPDKWRGFSGLGDAMVLYIAGTVMCGIVDAMYKTQC